MHARAPIAFHYAVSHHGAVLMKKFLLGSFLQVAINISGLSWYLSMTNQEQI